MLNSVLNLTSILNSYKKYIVSAFIAAAAGGSVLLYITFMPGGLYEYSESAEFCAKCHLHETHYKDFNHSAAHRGQKCVDCHLPNNNKIEHLVWKSIDGNKDLFLFFTGNFSDNPRLSNHGKNVVQNNCVRCHSEVVFKMDTERRNCVDCHRTLKHKTTGIF